MFLQQSRAVNISSHSVFIFEITQPHSFRQSIQSRSQQRRRRSVTLLKVAQHKELQQT